MRKERFVSEGSPAKGAALARFAVTVSVSFTVVMAATLAMGSAFAPREAQGGIMLCWSILIACVLAAALQMVFFTDLVFKRMGTAARTGVFGGCLYGVLAVVGSVFEWFPTGNAGAWVSFTVFYMAVLAVLTVAFRAAYRSRAREYDDRLKAYRSADEA